MDIGFSVNNGEIDAYPIFRLTHNNLNPHYNEFYDETDFQKNNVTLQKRIKEMLEELLKTETKYE